MSREIKFRYKTKNGIETFTLEEVSLGIPYSIDNFRGQWTGLKDKNGTEIYEGDIIYHQGRKAEVIWCNDANLDTPGWGLWVVGGGYMRFELGRIEVIGNIYERM